MLFNGYDDEYGLGDNDENDDDDGGDVENNVVDGKNCLSCNEDDVDDDCANDDDDVGDFDKNERDNCTKYILSKLIEARKPS